MIESFVDYVKSSEAAIYALSLSTITPLIWKLPTALISAVNWVKSKSVIDYEFHYSDATFTDFNDWLKDNKNYLKFNRSFRVYSETENSTWNSRQSSIGDQWGVVPSYGTCILKPKSYPFMLMTRTKDESKKDLMAPPDIIHLKSLFWNKDKIKDFILSINKKVNENENNYINMSVGEYFTRVRKINAFVDLDKMPVEFIDLYEDMKKFFDEEEWYRKNGIHKRGYLLYGVPGTGKSRSVIFLAQLLKKDLYIIRNGDLCNLQKLLNNVPEGSVVLMEEIDTAPLQKRSNSNKEKGNFEDIVGNSFMSDVLNALDGALSYEGSAIIATTNHIDKLDPAVIREGRFDVKIEFKPYDKHLIEKFFRSFYNYSGWLSVECESCTVAKLNSVLMANRYNMNKAAELIGIKIDNADVKYGKICCNGDE